METGRRAALLSAALLVSGCGSHRGVGDVDGGVRGPDDAWLVFDAAMIPGDAGRTDGGRDGGPADGGADLGCTAAMSGSVLTNQPSVTYVDQGDGTMPLVTSTFFDEFPGTAAFVWLGEVRNTTTHVVCPSLRVDVSGSMRDAAIAAKPHWDPASGGTIVSQCVDAGDVFVAYDVTSISIADAVARGTVHYQGYSFVPSLRPPPDPAAPTATISTMLTSGRWHATGTLSNGSSDIHNLEVAIYPRDACGLLGDSIAYFHLASFYAFSSEPYTTIDGSHFDFHSQLVFMSYIRGL